MPFPFVDLGTAIVQALGAPQVITVDRYPASTLDPASGEWLPVAPEVSTWDAVVQPAGARDLEQLPENERTRETIALFVRGTTLVTSSVDAQTEADVVTWEGKRYKVVAVEQWNRQANYSRALATRLTE